MKSETVHRRKDHELPRCIREWGWSFHHVGIPATEERRGETFIEGLKFYVSGFYENPFGAERMRFEPDSPVHELIRTIPHIAFVVEDLERELSDRGFTLLSPVSSPSEGVRVEMIVWDGVPVELMEFHGGR